MTGVRNGYLPGVPVILSVGENIRQAIIDTIKLAGFTKYIVEEAPGDGNIPMDLEFPQGSTVYDLLNGLNQIYPFHEIFLMWMEYFIINLFQQEKKNQLL